MDDKRISLPGWRIIRVIGKGSFGCVYEVEKEGAFGSVTHSALKVIHIPETEDELRADRDCWPDDASLTKLYQSRVESVTAEFELMSALKGDSHIVSYEDHSIVQHEHDPGYDIFIRMELLTPLPDYIRRYYPQGVPSDEMVIKLGADICSALERCGKHHIIHRDIKPQNIFVNDNGDFKLGDFGIAKISDHTMSATKTGTYGYMAPEVYKAEPYNSSVDIYSLGIVLYWLLNARSGPFVSLPPAIPNAKQMDDALHRRMYGEPIPAPKYGSKALKRIILKACAFDPKERYQSPAEMRRDLEWLSGDRTIPASSTVQNTVQTPTSEPLPEMENCPFCGTKNKIGAVYCTCCGKPMRKLPEPEKIAVSTPTPQQKKDRKLAWIIAFVAAAFAVIAALVLIVVLAGKREPSEQAEVHPTAVVSAAPASEATTAPTKGSTQKPTATPTKKPTPSPEPTFTPTPTPSPEPTEEIPLDNFSFGGAVIKRGTTHIDGEKFGINGSETEIVRISKREVELLTELCPNLRELDLTYCCLETCEPLSKLVNLEKLELYSCYEGKENIHISKIDWIKPLVHLRQLGLNGNSISDISVLAGLTELTELSLYRNQISDISALKGMTKLEELYLARNQINDISALSGMKRLIRLELYNNQIQDISALKGLESLSALYISINQIENVDSLKQLTKLKKLDLGSNKIGDIKPLSGLTNLTILHLDRNLIKDITVLTNLTKLRTLIISNNQIEDINAIKALTKLTKLDLSDNLINDISVLKGLRGTEHLLLDNNQISNITALKELTSLTELHLNGNEISDLYPLTRLTKMEQLYLRDNQINDISALKDLANLTWLYLDGNEITDITALNGLTKLMTLVLSGNEISQSQISTLKDRLPNCKITY